MNSSKHYCTNHPSKKALSFCNSCKRYFCVDCLNEGTTYYYCKNADCQETFNEEMSYRDEPRFCNKCIAVTTDETLGYLTSVNFIGTSYVEEGEICPICGAITVVKSASFFGVPIARSKVSYRIIRVAKIDGIVDQSETFISRKVKL